MHMVIIHIVFKQKNNYAISHNLKISVLRHPNLILFTLDCFFFIWFSRRSSPSSWGCICNVLYPSTWLYRKTDKLTCIHCFSIYFWICTSMNIFICCLSAGGSCSPVCARMCLCVPVGTELRGAQRAVRNCKSKKYIQINKI